MSDYVSPWAMKPSSKVFHLLRQIQEASGQRIGQAIINALPGRAGDDPFYVTDEQLALFLED